MGPCYLSGPILHWAFVSLTSINHPSQWVPDNIASFGFPAHFHRRFSTVAFSSVFPPSLSLSTLFPNRFLFRRFPPFARLSFFNRFAPPKVSRQKLLNLEKVYVGYNLQILETRMKLEHIHQGGDSQYTDRTQSIYHQIRSSLVVKPWKKFKGNTFIE
uniref:Uncharacterized protein n=1 Tax=Cucumis melo TaxID=3656 RepID=A0A9I9EDF5_CUCME